MFAKGFVQEVEKLVDEGFAKGCAASYAIGYRQILEYLAGKMDLESAIESVKVATRRLARKQLGWFVRYLDCVCVPMYVRSLPVNTCVYGVENPKYWPSERIELILKHAGALCE